MAADALRLTPMQGRVLGAIAFLVSAHGFSPSLREIGAAVGLRSSATISHHVNELRRLGYISWVDGRDRTITLLSQAGPPTIAMTKQSVSLPFTDEPVIGDDYYLRTGRSFVADVNAGTVA